MDVCGLLTLSARFVSERIWQPAAQILWQEKGLADALWFVKADCQWSVLLGDGCEQAWWRWCLAKTLKKKNGGNL